LRHIRKISTIGRLLLLTAVILTVSATALAQQDAQLTQYWAAPTYYNPAATGDNDFVRIRGGAKLQWLGIKNAPQSFFGAADSPFKLFGKRLGGGVVFSSEKLGLFSNMLISGQLSFKLKALKGEFSIGVQPGYFSSSFKGTEVFIPEGDDFHQDTDEAIPRQDLTGSAFDLGAGVLYTHKYFWVGVSGQHLLNTTVSMSIEGTESNETQEYETELPRMLYFTAGGNIALKNTLFELQPSVLVKTDFQFCTAELTLRSTYNKFLTFGVGYRWNDAVSAMIGAEFKNIFLGYAYDYPLTNIAKGSSGSHELVIGYRLKLDFSGKNKNKHRSIRIM